ncbi:DUF2336 domain-containing protein [Zavarzinia sp. CC-PAN008]|uniref:DUF2336 domain-containing protein n=1 Tax=Zavarzinia sp. CC-PAN008 TaxID=3243332 RepID=UPI003F7465B2
MSELFEEEHKTLNQRERVLMHDILRQLSHDVEMAVRVRLAEKLANSIDAPHELIVLLANDRIEVAHPILLESKVLKDADLIEIVQQRTYQHQLTIAMRKDLSEDVSQALVDTGDEDVIVALLDNPDARITQDTLAYLVEQSERVDRFQNPLVHRPELPAAMARKMCAWVSAALRKFIVTHFKLDAQELDDVISETAAEVVWGADLARNRPSPVERLVEKLHNAGDLDVAFLYKALARGEVPLFEEGFARLLGVRVLLARRILYEPGGEGLAVACRALYVEGPLFLSLFKLTRKARNSSSPVTDAEVEAISAFYDRLTSPAARTVMRHWSRDGLYLDALRRIVDGET